MGLEEEGNLCPAVVDWYDWYGGGGMGRQGGLVGEGRGRGGGRPPPSPLTHTGIDEREREATTPYRHQGVCMCGAATSSLPFVGRRRAADSWVRGMGWVGGLGGGERERRVGCRLGEEEGGWRGGVGESERLGRGLRMRTRTIPSAVARKEGMD